MHRICLLYTSSIANALNEFFINRKNIHVINDIDKLAGVNAPRNLSTPGNYAYLKIAEGCDKYCTCLLYTSRCV